MVGRSLKLLAALIVALAVGLGALAQDFDPNATLTFATNADPTLNPWAPGAVIESNLINTILFEQLTRYSPEDLSPQPGLAVSWEASEDAMSWTFTLREGVVWSDGEAFDAEDVAFTFNNVVLVDELGAQSATQFSQVESVDILDPLTVRFNLNSPFSALPYYLAAFSGMLPEHALADAENPLTVASFNKESPVTTGAYRVGEYVPGSFVRLVPNESYWGEEPKLAGIVFRIIPDPNTQVAQLLAGDLDLVTRISPTLLGGVENNPNFNVLRQSQNLYYWVILNQNDERFTDPRVRQALLMALDREAMIDALLEGYGTVATGPIAPLLGAIYNSDVSQYPYDPEAAIALLNEAGWTQNADGVMEKDGQQLVISMPTGQFGYLVPATLLVQDFWADIGVTADVEVIEWKRLHPAGGGGPRLRRHPRLVEPAAHPRRHPVLLVRGRRRGQQHPQLLQPRARPADGRRPPRPHRRGPDRRLRRDAGLPRRRAPLPLPLVPRHHQRHQRPPAGLPRHQRLDRLPVRRGVVRRSVSASPLPPSGRPLRRPEGPGGGREGAGAPLLTTGVRDP